MKKLTIIAVIAILLCVAAVVCISIGYNREQAAEREAEREMEKRGEISRPGNYMEPLYKKPKSMSDYRAAAVAATYPNFRTLYEPAGITGKDLSTSKLSNPFVVFAFDGQGQVLEDETTYNCLLVDDSLVGEHKGRIAVRYSQAEQRNLIEYYKNGLIASIAKGTVDTTAVLTIGKLGSKTFVTDGVNLDILAIDETPHPDDLSDSELKALAATFKAAAGETYHYVCGYYITVQEIK